MTADADCKASKNEPDSFLPLEHHFQSELDRSTQSGYGPANHGRFFGTHSDRVPSQRWGTPKHRRRPGRAIAPPGQLVSDDFRCLLDDGHHRTIDTVPG